jgi:hypothetical protein
MRQILSTVEVMCPEQVTLDIQRLSSRIRRQSAYA